MLDLTALTEAKSDQLNADDLIGKNRIITITDVVKADDQQQPIIVSYEGDNGKPWKPCKTMIRALVYLWGNDASQFSGRNLELYRDPEVTYGKDKVGGIRIHAASHIDSAIDIVLTIRRGQKKPYKILKLVSGNKKTNTPQETATPPVGFTTWEDWLDLLKGALENAETMEEAKSLVSGATAQTIKDLKIANLDLHGSLIKSMNDAKARLTLEQQTETEGE
jgi:hypothetical protein